MWLSGEGSKGGAGRRGFDPPFYTWWCFQRKMCVKMKRGNTENEKAKQNESQEQLQILCLVLSRIVNLALHGVWGSQLDTNVFLRSKWFIIALMLLKYVT